MWILTAKQLTANLALKGHKPVYQYKATMGDGNRRDYRLPEVS